MKIKSFLEKFIQITFICLLLLIIYYNVMALTLVNNVYFLYSFLILLITFVTIVLYKKEIVSKKFLYMYIILLFIIGYFVRIYFIKNVSFDLQSDFQFAYENAGSILKNNMSIETADYLSYNGYSYVYSYILSLIFRIFPMSITTVLVFNMICQILSSYLIYKIIKLKSSKENALITSATFFLFPPILFAGLLVSTETPFILLFLLSIFVFYKINESKTLNLKNILSYALLGIIISSTNYIRPVMTIFIIAIIIYFIIKIKNLKEIVLLITLLVSYEICGFGYNKFVENGIGMQTRSGALGWSIYFGSNYDMCGNWSLEDSEFVSNYLDDESKGDIDLIKLALQRYEHMGVEKSSDLLKCKYRSLWIQNTGTYDFANGLVNKEKSKIQFDAFLYPTANISGILMILLCCTTIITILIEIKMRSEKYLFIELFGIGYILANLLVTLNSRYNLPLYPILLISSSVVLDRLLMKKNKIKEVPNLEKITKKNPKILLIIPAYNEEQVIKETVETVIKEGYDYIVINDGSTDNTEKILRENKFNHIELISNLGIGGAVQSGYKYAAENNYDVAVQFDADGQHDIKYVKDIVKPLIDGEAHFVVGSRFIEGSKSEFKSTKLRQIGIKLISYIIFRFSRQRIYDTTSGFRAANKDVIRRFKDDYPLEYPEPISSFELLKDGYTIKEVPVVMHERNGGVSSIMSWKKAYYMINVFLSIIVIQIRGDE